MSDNQKKNAQNNDTDLVKMLFNEGYIPGPKEWLCGSKTFSTQGDKANKTSGCTFRCTNNKCRRKYDIRINSFCQQFPQIKMEIIIKVLELFNCDEINVEKAKKILSKK